MVNGFMAAGVGSNMPRVNTCLVFIPEVLATPLDSTVMTFILVLTFLHMASASDHYTSNACRLHADKLHPQNEIVILLNTTVFPAHEEVNETWFVWFQREFTPEVIIFSLFRQNNGVFLINV